MFSRYSVESADSHQPIKSGFSCVFRPIPVHQFRRHPFSPLMIFSIVCKVNIFSGYRNWEQSNLPRSACCFLKISVRT